MAKKRKIKKKVIILGGIVAFFIIYFTTFIQTRKMETKTENKPQITSNKEQDSQLTLQQQLVQNKKAYLTNENIKGLGSVQIENEYWENDVTYFIKEFSKVRTPSSYKETYTGYAEDGTRFSTDLNYFRIYKVNKEEYYKIPVDKKEEFKKLLDKCLYTSFDFIRQYKSWNKVTITYKDETKKIFRWKMDDLAYKMSAKRTVGKVQPEKSKERSDYNFTINIEGNNYTAKIETMGKDYVKINNGKNKAYYEVYTRLYEYLESDIFKIVDKK